MRSRKFLKTVCGTLTIGLALGWSTAVAGPVEIMPVVVEGKLAPYSRVKKHNRIWYPASVVGFHRGIDFSYDYATQKLYANGVETYIKSVVVDDVVYVNMTPQVTQGDMRPGKSALQARRDQLQAFEGASSHMQGNTDALFMSEDVHSHAHPWVQGPGDRNSPIIDLDPTHEAPNAAHMRPGARPPSAPPESLPNRLPRPGEEEGPVTDSNGTVQIVPPTEQGMPRNVTTEGGPSEGSTAPSDTSGLQPIPVAPQVAPDTSPFTSSGKLKSSSSENSVFQVAVVGGNWQLGSDNLLKLKLTQTNISKVAQSNLGSFAVRCTDGTRVEASRTRSYLPDGTLAPGSLREGELVFRLTDDQKPQALELEGALGLSVPLHQM